MIEVHEVEQEEGDDHLMALACLGLLNVYVYTHHMRRK